MTNQKIEVVLTPDQILGLLSKCAQDDNLRVEFVVRVVPERSRISTNEAIELLGCGRTHLNNAVGKGIIKKVQKVTGRNTFDRQELLQLKAEGLI